MVALNARGYDVVSQELGRVCDGCVERVDRKQGTGGDGGLGGSSAMGLGSCAEASICRKTSGRG